MERYRKFIVAIVGALANAAALGLLPSPYDQWVAVLIVALTSLGVYAVPNTPPLPDPEVIR